MTPLIATILYGIGTYGLFYLERDRKRKVSLVLWIPLVTLFIIGSRPLTFWLGLQTDNSPEALLDGNPIDATFAFVLILAGALVLFRRENAALRAVQANPAIVAYLVYCGLSASWSDYPGVSFKRWIRLVGTFITVLLLITDTDPKQALRWVLTRVGFVLIPVSMLFIKYYPNISRYYDIWNGRQYFSGVSLDKNMLGMTCLVTGLATLDQLLVIWAEKKNRARNKRLAAYVMLLAANFWVLSMANSMTSIMCFGMGGTVLIALNFFKVTQKPIVAHMLVIAIVCAAFSVLFLHVGEGAALEQMGRDTTLSGRTEIWSGLLEFANNPLVGTGFESFWIGDRLIRIWSDPTGILKGINEAHNGYLETYLNLGWIGVALIGALIASGYANIISTLGKNREAARLRLAFFVVVIVYNFTEAGFRIGSSIWILFLFSISAAPTLRTANSRAQVLTEPRMREPEAISTAQLH